MSFWDGGPRDVIELQGKRYQLRTKTTGAGFQLDPYVDYLTAFQDEIDRHMRANAWLIQNEFDDVLSRRVGVAQSKYAEALETMEILEYLAFLHKPVDRYAFPSFWAGLTDQKRAEIRSESKRFIRYWNRLRS